MEIPFPKPAEKKPKVTLPPVAEAKGLTTAEVSSVARQLIANIEKVIVGKHEQVVLATAVWLAEGHLLIEDVPGVAKTMLARAMAQSAGCTFRRIQCTPDLLPSDVLGEPRLDPQTGRSEFFSARSFHSLFSWTKSTAPARARNRRCSRRWAKPTVTAGNVSYRLQKPFMVVATQNPIEQEGTFLLPEAQKDRFLMRTNSATLARGRKANGRTFSVAPSNRRAPAGDHARPRFEMPGSRARDESPVGSERHILAIVRATREHPALLLGASPRGSLGLFRHAQAMAAI